MQSRTGKSAAVAVPAIGSLVRSWGDPGRFPLFAGLVEPDAPLAYLTYARWQASPEVTTGRSSTSTEQESTQRPGPSLPPRVSLGAVVASGLCLDLLVDASIMG
jgi:hypothetical protein